MRKLDKTEILAAKYKEWEDAFVAPTDQPKYNSSNGKFYYDIIANLIWIQKGLCAYTEFLIQEYENYNPTNWKDGQFPKDKLVGNFAGQLDHYNPTLKVTQGWSWDNFFLIDSDINLKVKRTNVPLGILKPDIIDYDPFYYLEYDLSQHIFLPSRKRDAAMQKEITTDILTLGLNWPPMVNRRKKYLNDKIEEVKFGMSSYNQVLDELYQFFTAFELCKDYMLS